MIDTPRLCLLNCDEIILQKIIEGDSRLANYLQIVVPESWSEFGVPIFQFSLERLREDPSSAPWWTYLIILKSTNTLIGNCGFKGCPDRNATVEIGYEISPSFRNQGFATEAAGALIGHAFLNAEVQAICGHTLREENGSVKVLRHCGMKFIKEVNDPEDGPLWRWELQR